MNYGLPYKGSKNKIAKDIIEVLPSNETLVDLFAGGCAIAHCAMLSDKWQKFIINDVDTQILDLFVNAINGKYRDEKRVITREDFEQLKDSDPIVATLWSFGNDCKCYLWNDDTAGAKVLACKMVLADTWQERRRHYMAFILYLQKKRKELKQRKDNLERLQSLESLERLQRLESLQSLESLERLQRLESLQSLERLQRLEVHGTDYRNVKIPPNSTVYCDIPYEGTATYRNKFNHTEFWQWVRNQPFPVYVSEYNAPKDFKAIWSKEKTIKYNGVRATKTMEKLFVHEKFADNNTEHSEIEQMELF